ncbi:uncharacterized protein [Branchiostoma lanceolatum]|uniref:uncharacterized protein n=1 Tax=Branchiostoma lanceolatum TaxID=7740 RepID=UPI0034533588
MSPGDYQRFDLQENYCRNPFSYSRPLCFVINPHDSEHSFWDFCPIPNCYPTTTAPTATTTAAPGPTTVKGHITPHLPRASSTAPSKGGPSPAGVTASLRPGQTHAQPPSAVSRITQVTLPNGGSLQKSTDQSAVKACRLDQFQCSDDKRCISRQSVCDNLVDCSDRSDEEDCALRCAADEFFCDDLCYPAFFTCDGWADCADGSDENPANCILPDYTTTARPRVGEGENGNGQTGNSEDGNGQTGNTGGGNGQTDSGIEGNGKDNSSNTGANGTNAYQNHTSHHGSNGTDSQDGDSLGDNSGDQGNGDQGSGDQGNSDEEGHVGGMHGGGAHGKRHNLTDYEEMWLRFNLTAQNATKVPCPCVVFGRQLAERSAAPLVNANVKSTVFHSVSTLIAVVRLTTHII